MCCCACCTELYWPRTYRRFLYSQHSKCNSLSYCLPSIAPPLYCIACRIFLPAFVFDKFFVPLQSCKSLFSLLCCCGCGYGWYCWWQEWWGQKTQTTKFYNNKPKTLHQHIARDSRPSYFFSLQKRPNAIDLYSMVYKDVQATIVKSLGIENVILAWSSSSRYFAFSFHSHLFHIVSLAKNSYNVFFVKNYRVKAFAQVWLNHWHSYVKKSQICAPKKDQICATQTCRTCAGKTSKTQAAKTKVHTRKTGSTLKVATPQKSLHSGGDWLLAGERIWPNHPSQHVCKHGRTPIDSAGKLKSYSCKQRANTSR